MKLLIDTNILISAGLFPNSTPATALQKALVPPHNAVICDYSVDEMMRVAKQKFPNKTRDLETFLFKLLFTAELIRCPVEEEESESRIRDIKDRPLLRVAINARLDAILTGDKDFLESGITNPRIMTATQFLQLS